MERRKVILLLTALLSAGWAGEALANGFRLADQDAFAAARGEAFVATADNPSAIYYNPAGITQLEGNNLRAGIYGIYLEPGFTPTNGAANSGNTYHSSDNLAAVPQFFYAYTPTNFPLSGGVGVYAPYGGNISWPDDTGFRTLATDGSLTYITINPVVAIKLSKSFSIGGGLSLNYANMNLEQGLRPFPQPPNFYRFKGDGWSWGYNAGALWQPSRQISLGATFRSSATVTLNGRTEFEQYSAGIPFTTLPANADFEFPMTIVCGISYRPTPKWNLEFDADYTDWSSFSKVTIYQQGTAPLGFAQNPQVTLDWQASWMYEFGVTRYFDNGWHISAGYVYDQNSVPDSYYTPFAADLDRHFFSVGTGFKSKRLSFDITYQFGYGPGHTVTGSKPPSISGVFAGQNADGTYDFISHAIFVTAGLHF